MKPRFFKSSKHFRMWLENNHATKTELLVGFVKQTVDRSAMTWPQSVDVALCFGWIDGVRRRIDDSTYSIRFTPRRPTSIWSARNIGRMDELIAQGLVADAGLAAYDRRTDHKSCVYSFEQAAHPEFSSDQLKAFKKESAAWKFFQAQIPSYRKRITWWVISAKKEQTRNNRLQKLIDACKRKLTLLQ
jgi:uncharacterized protein YdeI (YjbR/CyaY-like superfamily)